MSESKYKYHVEIQQMMFVSGETHDPPFETTALIEDIVRGQVIEILLQAAKTAASRNSKLILPEDMIFLIRNDKAKVNRLRTYLSWKEVRKNAKDQSENNVDSGDFLEDGNNGSSSGGVGNGGAANSNDADLNKSSLTTKQRKTKLRFPWELLFMFSEQPLENENLANNEEADEDEEEKEAMLISMKRLKSADDRTRNMTREEYVHFSECRQASFTFRRNKRFKEWCGASYLSDSKPSDDVIDILGFLTFEMVCSLTEAALKIKHEELKHNNHSQNKSNTTVSTESKNDEDNDDPNNSKKRKHRYLFDGPGEAVKPLLPVHINEAYRRLQRQNFKSRPMVNFKGSKFRSKVQII